MMKFRPLFFVCSSVFFFVLLCWCGVMGWAFFMPAPKLESKQHIILYDRYNDKIGESSDFEHRKWTSLRDISPFVLSATLAVEDQRFYKHSGFDLKRIGGAVLRNLSTMSKQQGASTLTQQLARNLYLSHEKSWKRKVYEAFYTVRLEMHYSKEELLEAYLNSIYYGEGAYGIEAAAQHYFGVSSKELDLAQAALLAGIPKGPSYYSPKNHFENAKSRQQLILSLMYQQGKISEAVLQKASKQNISLRQIQSGEQYIAPDFQNMVYKELFESIKLNDTTLLHGGLRVYTTLDSTVQQRIEEAVAQHLSPIVSLQSAVVLQQPSSGAVLGMLGGRLETQPGFNRVVQSKRQPGSTFKPFLYYVALENGFTPSTLLRSEPTVFHYDESTQVFAPSNFNHLYPNDMITLAQAVAVSDNIYAVKTYMKIGTKKLVPFAKQLGFKSQLNAYPSLALGTSEVTPLEMNNAYAHFANGGKSVTPYYIEKVTDKDGHVLYEANKAKKQLLNANNVFIMNHLLQGMFNNKFNGYTKVTGYTLAGQLSQHYAGKSGSTNTDSWMIGYTPAYVSTVWIGFDDNAPLRTIEQQTVSKKIWATLNEKLHRNYGDLSWPVPDDVTAVEVGVFSGGKSNGTCAEQTTTEYSGKIMCQLPFVCNKGKIKKSKWNEMYGGSCFRMFF